ncbi:hypothetical protein EKO27_g10198 [Xylaria grammica]|uniref:Uncharacterized protein n=1 Tax=Xylaria grammica TaxID=363999 RepID=A0A439CS53_9PEZI|nr:hypothetical protein EKO27_g10198 [Xylaria grammica]
MAQEQALLPKGIVHNRNAIYEEIAKYDVLPVEQILRACHVFSTTSRELYDPTARRLENFWTRVLGGNRRYLPGRVIAQLFRDISEETSFVKLRGPHNRYEPTSSGSSASKPQGVQATHLASVPKPKAKPTTPSAKAPRPILKRPRGPSASGPRPTARFVSPPESGMDEDSTKLDKTTASTTLTTPSAGASARFPGSSAVKEERAKGRAIKPSRKTTAFAASTASRRRPGMPRRSSSQSSAGATDAASKEGDSSLGSKGSQSSVPTIPEKLEQQPDIRCSKKTSKPGPARSSQSRNEAPPAGQGNIEVEPLRPAQLGRDEKSAGSPKNRSKTFSSAGTQRKDTQQRPLFESSPLMSRSSSDVGIARPISREASRALVPPSSLMSSTLAKLDTSVIGQGTITGFSESTPTQIPALGRLGEGGNKEAYEEISQTPGGSRLGQQSTTTQPSPTTTVPLARSKSQLTILLDRKVEKKKSKR